MTSTFNSPSTAPHGTDQPHPTLWTAFSSMAGSDPAAPCVIEDERIFSREQIRARAAAVCAGLASLGVRPGTQIALWMPNCADWLAVFLAASKLGASVVALNTRYRSSEVVAILRHSEAVVLVTAARGGKSEYLDILREIAPELDASTIPMTLPSLPSLKHVVVAGAAGDGRNLHDLDDLAASAAHYADTPAAQDAGAPLVVLYTSGTTAASKGVMQTEGALLRHARTLPAWTGLASSDRMLMVTAFCGIYGLNALLATVFTGAVCLVPPTLEADGSLDHAERAGATILSGTVDTFLRRWAASQRQRPRNLSAMRGRVVPAAWLLGDPGVELPEFESALGITLVQTYGLSEANSMILLGDPRDSQQARAAGDMWPIHPSIAFSLRHPGAASEPPRGEIGEMCFHGWTVTPGYLRNPEATREALGEDAWLRTGDLAQVEPNGAIRYKGRSKDILKIAGYTVAPAEIENFLCGHPAVTAAQVVGLKDAKGMDVIAAAVIRAPGAEVSDTELMRHCADHLASFKVPRLIGFLDTFPITPGPNGEKVQKVAVRQLMGDLLARRDAARAGTQP
jgi:fatty-acyl-CoA synthase